MSSNLLDTALIWIGDGAGRPTVCVPFQSPPIRRHRFGEPDGAGVHDSLLLEAADGVQFRAPANGFLWRVPSPVSLTDSDDVLPDWPHLTRVDGHRFDPRKSPADFAEFDLLLDVWPSAFRRLEYIFSSLEIPASVSDWELPQMPAPRWFWIRGVGDFTAAAQAIANSQFSAAGVTPDMTRFNQGKVPLYVSAGAVLTLIDEQMIEVRAFDALGAPIDPDWVFATFDQIGTDSDFTALRFAWPGGQTPWNPPQRHVITFCDAAGAPYVSRRDPDGDPLLDPPAREFTVTGASVAPITIPPHGVLVIDDTNPAYTPLVDTLVQFELPGEHQRVTLLPHGTLAKRSRASFGAYSFFRVQVVDLARWFPTSANPRNSTAGDDAFKRYTDGNEIVPLVDGRHMLREVYRAIRATHVVETYASEDHVPALDPATTPAAPAQELQARAKVLLSNAWIDADTAMLGRRAMIATSRTQTDPLPAIDELIASSKVLGALPPGTTEDLAASSGSLADCRLWWLVTTMPLPPGTYLQVRQFAFVDQLRGDDPRLPGILLGEDIYGVLAPLGGSAGTGTGFAGTSGQCVVPVLLKNGELPRAQVRLVSWAPANDDASAATLATSGKGTKRIVASGELTLPVPPGVNLQAPPTFDRAGVQAHPEMRLEFDGVPGRAVVVIAPGALSASVRVVIVNQRTGEATSRSVDPNPSDDVRIPIEPFGLRDWVLVGFPDGSAEDPADAGIFFMLRATPEQMMAGAALGHKTEVLGLLQEALLAGVDTRLIAWKATDVLPDKRIYSATGLVASLNAGVGGHRGQAILDSLTRREFCVHHQKGAFIRTARTVDDGWGATAFLGGIDLLNRRWDNALHDAVEPDRQDGPWHDLHCRVRGRAVWDVYRNFRQRWNAALQHPELVGSDPGWTPLPPISDVTAHGAFVEDDGTVTLQDGDCTAQVNRTLSPYVPAYDSFLEQSAGDQSIRKAYTRIIDEARRFLYIEDQYFWDRDLSKQIHDRLVDGTLEFMMLLMPVHLSEFQTGDLVLYAQRRRSLLTLLYGSSELPDGVPPPPGPQNVADRVVVFNIRNDADEPVYVHCKTIIADDLWVSISSSNLTRRSMTYDGEIGLMSIDRRTRRGGQQLARDLRVTLMCAHLGLSEAERALVDEPREAFRLVKDYLAGLWHGRHLPIERSGIAEMDLRYTHYGVQPADADGTFVDAIAALADPDGNREDLLPAGLLDARELMAALASGDDEMPFGGIGMLRLAFDVSALGPPANIVVHVSIIETGAAESTRVDLGTFPAGTTVGAGIVAIGGRYTVTAHAALVTSPATPLGSVLVRDLAPLVMFDTTVPLAFHA